MTRFIGGACTLAFVVSAAACNDSAEIHHSAAPLARSGAGAGALVPRDGDDDANAGIDMATHDANATTVDAGAISGPGYRQLDLPRGWSEAIASTCHSDSELCSEGVCPTFADGLEEARRNGGWAARDYCISPEGEPFITLAFSGFVWGATHVYDAESGELVARMFVSDVPEYCAATAPSNRLVTGRFIEDCLWVRDPPVPCTDLSAPELRSFDSCLYDFTP